MQEWENNAYYEYRSEREFDIRVFCGEFMNFPAHLHVELEMFLVQSGSVEVMAEGKIQVLHEGDFVIIFPNTVHAYHSLEEKSAYCIAICSPEFFSNSFRKLSHYHPVNPFFKKEQLHPDIPYALNALFVQQQEPNVEIYRALIQLILARITYKMELEPDNEPKYMDLTSKTVRYIAQNFQQPLSLEILARKLGVSKYHLSHLFSARLHTSFTDYINSLRISSACELLCETDQSILEICLNCGFSSQRTFNRVFKERTGLSPREFRTRHEKQNDNDLYQKTVPAFDD